MRILYIDLDSTRPDHMGCYGYHRNTTPNIDKIAAQGVRFNHCYISDAPCLPSRSSMMSGRFGIHTGVVNHGGIMSQMFHDGEGRGFRDRLAGACWPARLRQAGFKTVAISPFGERHAAWHWYAGFNEIHNTGKGGMEIAPESGEVALEWMENNAEEDSWFMHLNFWDPHTFYRTPGEYGNPFDNDPLPAWYTEEIRQEHWTKPGPHSAQEVNEFYPLPNADEVAEEYPRQPQTIDSMDKARMMFDGYDTGLKYADEWVGKIFDLLEAKGVLDDTVIMITADHGENLGELNIYGDHQLADAITTHVPMIVRYPGVTDAQAGRVDEGIYYQNDFAATVTELAGGSVPEDWDGAAFTEHFKAGEDGGREYVVVSQNAWSCQRGVRFRHEGIEYMCVRSYHDGYHAFPDLMLFDLTNDPHEQNDLAEEKPELVNIAMRLLDQWMGEMMRTATHGVDPMWQVMKEGGSLHTRGQLPAYLKRLRATGREQWADHLEAKHPREC